MPKQLKDILNGVKSSKKGPLSIGKDPGVDYKPKAGDEDKFVAKHEIEDHEDRVGNKPNAGDETKYDLNFSAEKRHGHKKGDDKKVYEAKKAEDMQCNHSAKGVACPVHGMAECYDMKTIKEDELDEVSKDSLMRYRHAAAPQRRDPEKGEKRKAGMNLALKKILGGDELGNKPKVKAAGMSKKEIGEELVVAEEAKQYIEVKNKYTGAVRHIEVHPSRAFEALNKYKDKNNTARIVTKKPVKEDVEQVDEAVNPVEVASNPGMYETDTLKKAYYHKKANEDDKKILARHLDRRHGVRDWRKSMKEEVEQVDEVLTKSTTAGETIDDFIHSDNPKFAGKSKEKRKQMALAAYYKKQNEETIQEAVPRGDTDGAEEMVKSELKALANKAMHLAMAMPQGMHVEPWVQAKIAQAKSYVSDVHDYMIFGDHPDEEDEQAPADTPMTFPSSTVDTGRI